MPIIKTLTDPNMKRVFKYTSVILKGDFLKIININKTEVQKLKQLEYFRSTVRSTEA